MSYISSTVNLINLLTKLPKISNHKNGETLQIAVKGSDGKDIAAFELQGKYFGPVATALVSAVTQQLLLRKNLLKEELDTIKKLNLDTTPSSANELLEVILESLYDSPEKYPEILLYLDLRVESENEFKANNDYDYREYLNDTISEKIANDLKEIKYLYQKLGFDL